MSVVSLRSLPSMSGYHSPHLPALHPGGFDGMLTTWVTSRSAIRDLSQLSTVPSTNTALGPFSVCERRMSYSKISASLP